MPDSIENIPQNQFDIPVEKIGKVAVSEPGKLLGLPLIGPYDDVFREEMAEISRMEREAWSDSRDIRL